MSSSDAQRAQTIRRAVGRLCVQHGWAPIHEVPLANGRRADILALLPTGHFACVEIKSGPRDFLADSKWHEYRDFSDWLYFAVDTDFPVSILPADVGLIVTAGLEGDVLREPPPHPMPSARRRALLHQFAALAAMRLAMHDDYGLAATVRAGLRAE